MNVEHGLQQAVVEYVKPEERAHRSNDEKAVVVTPSFDHDAAHQVYPVQIVEWNTPFDPENPLQWTERRKWTNVALIAMQATLTPIASTLPAVAIPQFARDFNTASRVLPALPIALYVLGFGLGPLYLAPVSEAYGRRVVYIVSYTVFAVLNVGCALAPSLSALSVLRLLSGIAGSAGPTLGGASIGDMFVPAKRGRAQALYSFGPTGGPVLGGVLGAFILGGTGTWRWLMWVTAIAPGATAALNVIFLHETYGPVLLRRRAKSLQRSTPELRFQTREEGIDVLSNLRQGMARPLRFLVTNPICSLLALYIALLYGIFYLHMLSLSLLFAPESRFGLPTYGWSLETSGLSFLGVGTGIVWGNFLSAKFSNQAYAYMNARRASKLASTSVEAGSDVADDLQHPESRMLLFQIGTVVVPIGLIMFAWSAGRTHWIVPLIGASIFGTGIIVVYVAFQTYLVDIFGRYAASALAASVILRSVIACVLVMFGIDLYKATGYAWGTTILVFVCVAIIPVPFLLYRYGPALRRRGGF